MFSLFGRRAGSAGTKTIAILDVGSGSVAGAIGRLNKDGLPQLLFSVREEFPMRMHRSAKELASDAAKTAKSVMDKVRKAAALNTENDKVEPIPIEHVSVFLAAPWSSTHIRTLRFARSKPFSMSADVLRRMLAEEARAAESRVKVQTRIIERIATGLTLNGYEAHEMSSAPVTSAEVTLATTLAPEAFLDLLSDAIGEPPRGAEMTFHSFALPAAHALSLWRPENRDALIIDAGAELTELVVLRGGTPAATATIPAGHHVILRTLRSRAGMGKHEAVTTMKLAQLDGTRLSETMKEAIAEATAQWCRELAKALGTLELGGATPGVAYLFADAHALPWFSAALARAPLYSAGATAPIAPLSVAAKSLTTLAEVKGVPPDPFLLAELIFADARLDDGKTLSFSPTRDLVLGRPHATIVSK